MKKTNLAKKQEFILDTFKGTCELNNYKLLKLDASDQMHRLKTSQIDDVHKISKEENIDKVYFYSPAIKEHETLELGCFSTQTDIYRNGEMINLAVKFLDNLGLEEITVDIKGDEELIDNLESLDIVTTSSDEILEKENNTEYIIYVEDKIFITGSSNTKDKLSYFTVDFDKLMEQDNYLIEDVALDAYIKPESDEVKSDAFIIASNLKDAGFKVEVDYYNTKESIDSAYIITLNSNDIKNYVVKITDTKTNEMQEIDIDSIIEVLAFM